MTQQKLPNATAVLILGICSIITCCCWGIVGLALGIVALVLYHKDVKVYEENPELYSNYPNLKIGRVLAVIGLCLSALYLIITIYMYAVIGESGMQDMLHNLQIKMEQQQEENQ